MAGSTDGLLQATLPRRTVEYDRLDTATSTRVLNIHAFDKEKSVIYGSLEQIDMTRSFGRYIALSYTWGPAIDQSIPSAASSSHPCKPCTLYIIPKLKIPTERHDSDILDLRQLALAEDCIRVELEQNLSDFFFHYHNSFITWKIPLWIDAVCINQTNKQEVADQILLMGEIYSNADIVLVWLGDDREDLDTVLWLMRDLNRQIYRLMHDSAALGIPQEVFEASLSQYHPLDADFWKDVMRLEPPDNKSWAECFASFYRFFVRRRWFLRAWTLQEAVLAKNIRFACHATFFGFDELFDLDYHFSITSWNKRLFVDPRYLDLMAGLRCPKERGELYTIFHLRSRLEQSESTSNLDMSNWAVEFGRLLHLTHHQESTVDQDYVYSVLGMAQRFLPLGKPNPFPIHVNDSAADVFARSCELIIEHSGLGILSYVADRAEATTPGLPSWAVDWAARTNQSRIGSLDVFDATKGFPTNSEVSAKPVVKDKKLFVCGVKVDAIATVFPAFIGKVYTRVPSANVDEADGNVGESLGLDLYTPMAKILLRLFREVGLLYKNGELVEDAIRRTLTLDSVDLGASVRSASPNRFCKAFEWFLRMVFWLAIPDLDHQELESTTTFLSQKYGDLSTERGSVVLSILKDVMGSQRMCQIHRRLNIASCTGPSSDDRV